jgi:hypothetical protein
VTAMQTPPAPTLSTTAGRAGGHHGGRSTRVQGPLTPASLRLPAGRTDGSGPVLPAPDGASRRESARAERAGAVRVVAAPVRDRLFDWVCEAFALMVILAASYVLGLVLGLLWLIYGGWS